MGALDLQAHPRVGETLPEHRIARGAVLAGDREDRVELVLELELLAERRGAALEGERAHRHPPAIPGGADDVIRRRARVVEEHLAEFAVAGDLHDRADRDAGLLHRHQQVREAVMALGAGFRAAQDEAPVRPLRPGGPDLLAIDLPRRGGLLLVHESCARLDVREVRAGIRLGVALTPERFTTRDRRQEAALLLLAAERDQRRREQPLADVTEPPGSAGACILFVPDHLLQQRGAASADLLRPAEPDPAVGAEPPLPGAPRVDAGVLVSRSAASAHDGELATEVRVEPRLRLPAERLVFVREAELHGTLVAQAWSRTRALVL